MISEVPLSNLEHKVYLQVDKLNPHRNSLIVEVNTKWYFQEEDPSPLWNFLILEVHLQEDELTPVNQSGESEARVDVRHQ